MKKNFMMIAIAATAVFTMAACGNKTNKGEGADSTATEQSAEAKFGPMGTWDFPETLGALKDVDNIEYVLFPGFYADAMEKGEDPATATQIYYRASLVEAGEKASKVKAVVDVDEVPNSLLIPIYKGATAKKGDIVLTWWQSGSGMQQAIVTDDSNPAEPKISYLTLSFKGDGTGIAEKDQDQLKPNSFIVLSDGKWEPGQPIIVKKDGDENLGIILNMDGDKILWQGFASKVYVSKKSDCRLMPLKPAINVGDKVKYEFVGELRDGATVTKYDANIGRVWVKKENSDKEEIKSIFEIEK